VIGSIGLTPNRNADITRVDCERDGEAQRNAERRQPEPVAQNMWRALASGH